MSETNFQIFCPAVIQKNQNTVCPHHSYGTSIKFVHELFEIIRIRNACNVKSKPFIKQISCRNHFCYECSILILQETAYFLDFNICMWHNHFEDAMIDYNNRPYLLKFFFLKYQVDFLRFLQCRDSIRTFLSVISHSEILNIFYRKKVLFKRFVQMLYFVCEEWYELSKINQTELCEIIKTLLKTTAKHKGYPRYSCEQNALNTLKTLNANIIISEIQTLCKELAPILYHHINILSYHMKSPSILKWLMSIYDLDFVAKIMMIQLPPMKLFVDKKLSTVIDFNEFAKNPLQSISLIFASRLQSHIKNGKILKREFQKIKSRDKYPIDVTSRTDKIKCILLTMQRLGDDILPFMTHNQFTFSVQSLLSKSFIKCSNKNCNRKYLNYKYGEEDVLDKYVAKKQLRIIHRWKICKRCQMHYYCGKKCQKIDWNIGGHKIICNKIALRKSWIAVGLCPTANEKVRDWLGK